ncbi:sensor histidine kinase [Priestia endophytica]|uniref:sensor histidine kinase n=1 Tax=Priestia endophytica TaxID=135735 RepID=UPI000DCA4F0E|nr:HAMP domain-containing sensor histidine kinase [Priestia endophytica]RAS83577.1 two-component sensor histidine kinase [Priestia endophytica]
MFHKTRLKLTIVNSLVFIILMGILAIIIYSYADSRLNRDVNNDLQHSAQRFTDTRGEETPRMEKDPRMIILIWNDENEIINQLDRLSPIFSENEKEFAPTKIGEFQEIEADEFSFRALSVQAEMGKETVTVQFVRNVTSEQEMLHTLFLLLLVGGVIGSICAVGAGFLLAGRALVPIKAAWKKQQDFVSDASHELRTPLAVIQSRTDLLWKSPSATIQEKAMDISLISKESRRLSKLVGNLLMLARSDSGSLEMEKETFSLSILLEEIHEYYEEIVSYQGKSIMMRVEDSIHFKGDKERIHQLMIILLDNALKFTTIDGCIEVSCRETPSSINIEVKDNGIGLQEEEIPKIFNRFYQVDKVRSDEGGAGLGLSIARWIIDKHYGKVKVTSKLGEGTNFEITFPKNQRTG